jgi:hypothetical protein
LATKFHKWISQGWKPFLRDESYFLFIFVCASLKELSPPITDRILKSSILAGPWFKARGIAFSMSTHESVELAPATELAPLVPPPLLLYSGWPLV